MSKSVKQTVFTVLEAGKTNDWASTVFDGFMVALIIANVVAFALETVPSVEAAYGSELAWFNLVSVIIFTIEYAARLWICTEHIHLRHRDPWRARVSFALTPSMVIDFLAFAPFYFSAIFAVDLRILRVLRLVRLLKLARSSTALTTLGRVIQTEQNALLGALLIIFGLLMVSATGIYMVESAAQPDKFGTIPDAMWWALATLTTVGYGDVVPVTALGKMVGGFVMILGLMTFALPVGIIATGFSQEIHRNEFVVNWGLVARVPLFSGLDATEISEVMGILQSQVVPAGAYVLREGDAADRMYFITLGEVEVIFRGQSTKLGEGDHFGELALLDNTGLPASVRAMTKCHLLYIEAVDFKALLSKNKSLAQAVQDAAEKRRRELAALENGAAY